jgi:hypothetical protein
MSIISKASTPAALASAVVKGEWSKIPRGAESWRTDSYRIQRTLRSLDVFPGYDEKTTDALRKAATIALLTREIEHCFDDGNVNSQLRDGRIALARVFDSSQWTGGKNFTQISQEPKVVVVERAAALKL